MTRTGTSGSETGQPSSKHPSTIRQVVENGLCIGCGLCQALQPDRWVMKITREGRLRPSPLLPENPQQDKDILQSCPGAVIEVDAKGTCHDDIWGSYCCMGEAWAGDPDIRYRAATGGVLTALGVHLLDAGKVSFILHCAVDPASPMRTVWALSETSEEVISRCGSRYGPSDTLAGLEVALARQQPFAVIAKPCDANAVRTRAKSDARLDQYLKAVLVMVCGGASDLGKSQNVLDEFSIQEDQLNLFRYRGYGCPGPTQIETKDGRKFTRTYMDMWADEAGWRIQTRCKICPDAIGEAADLCAADIWPGGSPAGEDEGFNGLITRSDIGQQLVDDAVQSGHLVLGRPHTPRDYDDFQPHQVRKKKAVAARLRGMVEAGSPVYAHKGVRLELLDSQSLQDQKGTYDRVKSGRFRENIQEDL